MSKCNVTTCPKCKDITSECTNEEIKCQPLICTHYKWINRDKSKDSKNISKRIKNSDTTENDPNLDFDGSGFAS